MNSNNEIVIVSTKDKLQEFKLPLRLTLADSKNYNIWIPLSFYTEKIEQTTGGVFKSIYYQNYQFHCLTSAFSFLILAAILLNEAPSLMAELVVIWTPHSQAVVWQGIPCKSKGVKASAFSSDSLKSKVTGASVSHLGKSLSSQIWLAEKFMIGTLNGGIPIKSVLLQ